MIINYPKIQICGMGPGNPSYWTSKVQETVACSRVVIAGERHLQQLDCEGKEQISIGNNIQEIIDYIKENRSKQYGIFVSGDTGFYSILHSLKKHFTIDDLDVFPGISSYQYMYARLGLTYENARLWSAHGLGIEGLENEVLNHDSVFVLTDSRNNWKAIAGYLIKHNLGNAIMHIGNNLSYDDEAIISMKADELVNEEFDFRLCSVIIDKKHKSQYRKRKSLHNLKESEGSFCI